MEHEILISDYLDGTLSAKHEEQLFSSLAQSQELRHELRQQLAMKAAIRSDVKAFTPKADSTMRIFSELGFAPAAPAAMTLSQKLASFIVAHKVPIISSFASVAMTVAAFLLLWPRSGSEFGNVNYLPREVNQVSAAHEIPVAGSYAANIDVLDNSPKSPAQSGQSIVNSSRENVIVRYVYLDEDSNVIVNRDETRNLSEKSQSSTEINNKRRRDDFVITKSVANSNGNVYISDMRASSRMNGPSDGFTAGADFNIDELLSDESFLSRLNLAVEFAASQEFFTHEVNVHPASEQVFNNSQISILVSPITDLQVGTEYRRENFYQVFRGYGANGNLFEYEQQPNFETFTLKARYKPDFLRTGSFSPFVSGAFGVNNAGYVSRIGGGVIIFPDAGYSFLVTTEYSGLRFMHNDAWFYSNKLGLNLGISVNF